MSRAGRQSETFEKLGDFVLRTEPLWSVPLYLLLVFNSPYFWAGWIIALIPWPLRLWRKGYLLPRTLFDIPILIFIIGMIVGLIYSDHKSLSIEAFQSYLCVILFYYALADGHWTRDWKLWSAFLALFVLLASIFILPQAIGTSSVTPFNEWFIEILPTMPSIFDFTANVNGLAIILDIIIPILFAISILGVKLPRLTRVGAAVLALIFLFLLAVTNSRGGWIATGIALLVVFVWRTKWALIITPIVVGLVIVIWQTGYDPLHLFQLGIPGNSDRIQIWQITVEILRDYPLIGCGLGAFPAVFSPYAPPQFRAHPNPHNAYLMLYSDTGIIGVLAAVLAVSILIITIIKIWRTPNRKPSHAIAIGIIASLIAFGVHGVFEASSASIWIGGSGNYRYLAAFIPWLVAGWLAAAMKKL